MTHRSQIQTTWLWHVMAQTIRQSCSLKIVTILFYSKQRHPTQDSKNQSVKSKSDSCHPSHLSVNLFIFQRRPAFSQCAVQCGVNMDAPASPAFPAKIWVKIFGNLSAFQLTRTRLVCRQWYGIVCGEPSLIGKFTIARVEDFADDEQEQNVNKPAALNAMRRYVR